MYSNLLRISFLSFVISFIKFLASLFTCFPGRHTLWAASCSFCFPGRYWSLSGWQGFRRALRPSAPPTLRSHGHSRGCHTGQQRPCSQEHLTGPGETSLRPAASHRHLDSSNIVVSEASVSYGTGIWGKLVFSPQVTSSDLQTQGWILLDLRGQTSRKLQLSKVVKSTNLIRRGMEHRDFPWQHYEEVGWRKGWRLQLWVHVSLTWLVSLGDTG